MPPLGHAALCLCRNLAIPSSIHLEQLVKLALLTFPHDPVQRKAQDCVRISERTLGFSNLQRSMLSFIFQIPLKMYEVLPVVQAQLRFVPHLWFRQRWYPALLPVLLFCRGAFCASASEFQGLPTQQ